MKIAIITSYALVLALILSCSNSVQIENTSVEDADTISTIGKTIQSKNINSEYFYYFRTNEDGVIKYKFKSSSVNGFSLDLLDSNGLILLSGDKLNDSIYSFESRVYAGSYYIKVKNSEINKWSADLSYVVDAEYIPITEYSRYIVGTWKLDKVCNYPSGELGGCTYVKTSELTKYLNNGTDSVFLGGGQYGSFDYKIEYNQLINTGNSSDTTWTRKDSVELTYSWLKVTPGDKPKTVYVYKRQ